MSDSDIAARMRKWAEVLKIPSGSFVNEDCTEAASEITRLTARVAELEEVLKEVDAECSAAIAYEPLTKGYATHAEMPNGLRTVSHIKFSMIQACVRAALNTNPERTE